MLRDRAQGRMPEVLDKAFEMALKGDRAMIKLLIEMHMSRNIQKEEDTGDRPPVQIFIQDLTSKEEPATVKKVSASPDVEKADVAVKTAIDAQPGVKH